MFTKLFTFYLANFSNYVLEFNKTYNRSEYKKRELIYSENVNYINYVNSLDLSYELGVNQFTDITHKEFNHKLNVKNESKYCNYYISNPPIELDWRKKNVVTPVKNQQQCGSCWAFSAVVSLEGLNAIRHHKLVSLSEQELVDCSNSYSNEGCNGGWMDDAFAYVRDKGICKESEYPYKAEDGTCKKRKPVVHIKDYCDIPPNNEDLLLKYVSIGPVSVAIEADSQDFQLYKSGIFNSSFCGEELDHGVAIVGYGSYRGLDYWLVKNSWDTTWGDEGYIKILRGVNMCGIALKPSIPMM